MLFFKVSLEGCGNNRLPRFTDFHRLLKDRLSRFLGYSVFLSAIRIGYPLMEFYLYKLNNFFFSMGEIKKMIGIQFLNILEFSNLSIQIQIFLSIHLN